MTNAHSLKGYSIPFETKVPTRADLLKRDITVAKASGLFELESLLLSDQLDEYVTKVTQEYEKLRHGNLSVTEMQRIVELARGRAKSYWNDDAVNVPVRILSAIDMQEAAMGYKEALYRMLGPLSPIKEREHTPHLPSFVDYVNGELILSERYIPSDLSGLGKEDAPFPWNEKIQAGLFPWNEKILEAVVTFDIGTHVIRSLRGETGDGYIQMLRNVPGNVADNMHDIVRSAGFYAFQEGLQNGGVPVLYMRLFNIFLQPGNYSSYFPMQVLADKFGIKNACLWDAADFEETPSGISIFVYLTNRHPNYQNKHSGLMKVVFPYGYDGSGTFPESLLRQVDE